MKIISVFNNKGGAGKTTLTYVSFLGYTIYNAKKRSDSPNKRKVAKAHYNYAQQIPDAIREHIDEKVRKHLSEEMVAEPIGNDAVMHTHNTFPDMAQKYKEPMWKLPSCDSLDNTDKITIAPNRKSYEGTRDNYKLFARDFLKRVVTLDDWQRYYCSDQNIAIRFIAPCGTSVPGCSWGN